MTGCLKSMLPLPAPVVLASASPRRRQLLVMLGIDPIVYPAHIDEDAFIGTSPSRQVELLALQKAQSVFPKYPDAIIVAADTTVIVEGRMLNKPRDRDDARMMLKMLSGRMHTVVTGLAVLFQKQRLVDSRTTQVCFRQLESQEIDAYITTGSPFDKAGAYGIQDDCGALFVSHIEGCYYTVVGLPVELLYRMLRLLSRLYYSRR